MFSKFMLNVYGYLKLKLCFVLNLDVMKKIVALL